MAAAEDQTDLLRAKQYFGVGPLEVIDNVANAAHQYLMDALEATERILKDQEGLSGKEKQIEESIDKIEQILKPALDKNLDYFELFTLNNILRIPADLEMPLSAKETPQKVLAKQDERLESEIDDLKRRVLALHYVNETIKQRTKTLEAELKLLEPLSNTLNSIRTLAQKPDSQIAHTNAALREALVQAAQLQDLLRKAADVKSA